jgi:MinD-like ATPase involved in chromosome partitioning or flagellar assembly
MDSDAEMPNVGLHLGMYTYPTSLKEIVEQDVHIMSAMHVDKDSGLRVIPTALSNEPVQDHVEEAIRMIPDDYIVLIDSPPGYERPLERVIDTCDELIFVTTPEIPSVTDTFKLAQEAQQRGKTILGAVINMYSSPKKHLSVAEVEKSLEMPVLGVIDESKTVQKSIFDTQPAVSMAPYAKPSQKFKQIAADLTGTTYEPSLVDRVRRFLP